RPGFVPDIPSDSERPAGGDADLPSLSTPTPSIARAGTASPSSAGGDFSLLSGRFIYDEGAMVSKSAMLRGLQKKPFIEMNDEDAKELGLSEGDLVIVTAGEFEVQLPVRVDDIVRGSVFVPYDQDGLHANELMRGVNPRVSVSRR
ncbi:MAG TPA: molybdopterin dinucleotide binding domain-containing protein, partial [Actinomycetota bacterium]|nr:molybdopterin dinucleotide binding domain-containing protein [Actinomycetota bacterium]